MTTIMMEKKKEQELRTLEQLENEMEQAANSLTTATSSLQSHPWRRQRTYEQAVATAIETLKGIAYDLEMRRPMMVMTVDIPDHPCSDCSVFLNNLGEEHCEGFCQDPSVRASYQQSLPLTEDDEQ